MVKSTTSLARIVGLIPDSHSYVGNLICTQFNYVCVVPNSHGCNYKSNPITARGDLCSAVRRLSII